MMRMAVGATIEPPNFNYNPGAAEYYNGNYGQNVGTEIPAVDRGLNRTVPIQMQAVS